jgi:hypothetical protein
MGVMVLLFPLPGYVAKLVQSAPQLFDLDVSLTQILAVQQQRLKKTDARVQAVTESRSGLDYLQKCSGMPSQQ